MKKLIGLLSLIFASAAFAADVKISSLPLGSASSTGATDSFPFVQSSVNITKRLNLWDLINLPPIVSTYAPLASPTFTGTVTAPTVKVTTLTPSQAVVTDGSKFLSSLAYGSTSAASTLVQRDAGQNAGANNWVPKSAATAAAGATTTLASTSAYRQQLTGTSSSQTFKLPDATTLTIGWGFEFANDTTSGTLTVQDSASGAVTTIPAGGRAVVWTSSISAAAGAWVVRGDIPSNSSWGKSAITIGALSTAGPVITSSGGVLSSELQLALSRGGTNADLSATGGTSQVLKQTSLGGAVSVARLACSDLSNAVASCSTDATNGSNISSGTVGTTVGGTGLTSYTTGDTVYASATNTLSKLAKGTTGQVLTQGSTIPSWKFRGADVQSKTSGYTVLTSDTFLIGDATSAGFSFTLPAASNAGLVLYFKKIDSTSNAVTIARAGSDTIDGATSITLTIQYESVILVSDGVTSWYVF